MGSMSDIQAHLRRGARKLSYSALWVFYREGWMNLPEGCHGKVYDVYSNRCWTPDSGQCGGGGLRDEGDCFNREHSWPKSWWGGGKRTGAYTDLHHVFPSDGYVNGKRSAWPYGEVESPNYTSSEGHKLGRCSTAGISGTCFEPTSRVKGLLARSNLYLSVRYMNEFHGSNGVVNGSSLRPAYANLLLRWSAENPPAAWEIEFNNHAQRWQGNRNPFIDYPDAAQRLFS